MDKIVVGVDGSPNAITALRWAGEEADLHGAALEVVLAWSFLDQYHPDGDHSFDSEYNEESARTALAAWVVEAFGDATVVEQRVVCDLPARGLLEASDVADLLVLGARGAGGFEGLLLGSTSERVAQLATGPVAVVRATAPVRNGRVVVGVDGSARSFAALRWAAAEARTRDADLDVIHAWRLPLIPTPPEVALLLDYSLLEAEGRATLDSAVSDPALADVRVHPHFVRGGPARALIERAAGAGLLVVGSRGLGRVTGALLGSVSRQLLHHAPCPIVIV